MRRAYFVSVFIAAHIFFIFFQIHKHSKIIQFSYQKQKNEQKKELLAQKLQDLKQQFYKCKEYSSVKTFAQKKLNMKKVRLSQVQKLSLENQTVES